MTRFALFSDVDPIKLEARMNDWAARLPPGAKVRRTQLASTPSVAGKWPDGVSVGFWLSALVSYEMPETATKEETP